MNADILVQQHDQYTMSVIPHIHAGLISMLLNGYFQSCIVPYDSSNFIYDASYQNSLFLEKELFSRKEQ